MKLNFIDNMNKNKIKEIFNILEKYYTKKEIIELKYINNYTLLLSVLLSAQATDNSVNKATKDLFKIADTPEKILQLGEENLKKYLKTLNYYNTKTRHIIELSKILIEKFNSQIPTSRENLESLPGIGRKTANVILNIVFDKATIAVDTHVFRVSNRIGLVKAVNVLDTEMELYKVVPNEYVKYTNRWLVLLGRYICKARKPDCNNCPIKNLCEKHI